MLQSKVIRREDLVVEHLSIIVIAFVDLMSEIFDNIVIKLNNQLTIASELT